MASNQSLRTQLSKVTQLEEENVELRQKQKHSIDAYDGLSRENERLKVEIAERKELDLFLQTRYMGAANMLIRAQTKGGLVTYETLMEWLTIDSE